MNPEIIKQNVIKLQNAKATPEDIEEYVRLATLELQPQAQPVDNLQRATKFGKKLGGFLGGDIIGEKLGAEIGKFTPGGRQLREAETKGLVPKGTFAETFKGPSKKQIAGDVLQIGTTIGALALPAARGAKAIKAVSGIGRGAVAGLKAGAATGGIYGGLGGVSRAMKADQPTSEIIRRGLTGGAGGAVIGGAIGTIVGGISGGITAAKQKALAEATTPRAKDLPKSQYKAALRRGQISPATSTEPQRYIPSEFERQAIEKHSDLITKNPVKTSQNLMNEIARQDDLVGKHLTQRNAIFNTGELKNHLIQRLNEIDDVTLPPENLERAKTKVVEGFIKGLEKNDMESLWKARKLYDQQNQISKAVQGKISLSNEIKITFRDAIQDFISDHTDDVTYKALMKEMHGLYKINDIVATKAFQQRGATSLITWMKMNPAKAKLLLWILPAAGGGALLAGLKGD
jgi:hypothetical protein